MPTFYRLTIARPLSAWPFAAVILVGLTACTHGPLTPGALQGATPITHNCKPQETVGFSCELRDHRLLSLCASPGFEKFEGLPKDNPGYAYLVVGTPKGEVQYSYPPDPYNYKQHMFKGVPTNGIPYMFVASEKGPFFTLTQDDGAGLRDPGSAEVESLPKDWHLDMQGKTSPCQRLLNFEDFENIGPKMMFVGEWAKKERARLDAEKAKVK